MGRGKMYFTGKDRDTPYCAAIRRPALPVSRYVYRFILFRRIYIYIFLDFIARLAPRNTPRRGDLLKFYTVPVFTSEMYVKWKPRDGSSLSIWTEGMSRLFFLIVGGLLSYFSEQSEYFFGYFFFGQGSEITIGIFNLKGETLEMRR